MVYKNITGTLLSAVIMLGCNLFSDSLFAQAPSGYYESASGKTGNELKIALHNIIKGHHALSYSALWSAYNTTDKKSGTEKVWDIYSDMPGGAAPYEYKIGSDQCSGTTFSSEGHCYNREHTWPQSFFGSNMPMRTDLWIVYPTDGYVNGKRANYPYGEVGAPSLVFENGAGLGTNTYPGSPSTLCYEPHDSFKGDIARSYFYVATRYYSEDGGWNSWEMASGADLKPWVKLMLLDWHRSDPVSQKEIDRNNAVYSLQNNRNPYIDYPEFAECVFGTGDCSLLLSAESDDTKGIMNMYPNPAQETVNISFVKPIDIQGLEVYNIMGERKEIRYSKNMQGLVLEVASLGKGMYFLNVVDKAGRSYNTNFNKL